MSSDDYERDIKLYELSQSEEFKYIELHQNNVKFFVGIVLAILAATVAGVVRSDGEPATLFLLIGPVLIIAISQLAKSASYRWY